MMTKSGLKSVLCASLFAGSLVNAAENTKNENWEITGTELLQNSQNQTILKIKLVNTSVNNIETQSQIIAEPVVIETTIDVVPQIIQEEVAPEITPEQEWQAFFSIDYVGVHQRAFDVVKKSNSPQLDFWCGVMWPIAIGNFEGIMNTHINNNQPVPSIREWPVRGTAKKYNRELMKRLNADISIQKQAFINSL